MFLFHVFRREADSFQIFMDSVLRRASCLKLVIAADTVICANVLPTMYDVIFFCEFCLFCLSILVISTFVDT